jgi:hypothetical protein
MNREPRSGFLLRNPERKGPLLAVVVCLAVGAMLLVWHYQHAESRTALETVSMGLSREELAAVRGLIQPKTANIYPGMTQLSTIQVRGLEERLERLEKAIPLSDSLSAAANNDLRLLQRDIQALKEQQVFQGQMIKDQRAAKALRGCLVEQFATFDSGAINAPVGARVIRNHAADSAARANGADL